ncbi:MAG: lactoylglutathione lyase family protein [Bacteroidetes bacterium]|nr:MAG: lactoylglutathione lyase family protein [Bacteroidota bacterium]
MKNLINWFEIPAKDFDRAVKFYKSVLDVEIHEAEMFGSKMGFFPSDGKHVSGAIVKGEDYAPSMEGVTIYLNAGDDLQPVLDKVESNKGKVIVPKTQISPEMGYFAMFIDTEGNKLALHSIQ